MNRTDKLPKKEKKIEDILIFLNAHNLRNHGGKMMKVRSQHGREKKTIL